MTLEATTSIGRYALYLESLTPGTLERLPEYVAADVRFKDPFNDVRGADAMARVFRHMFKSVGPVRFRIEKAVIDGDVALMTWRFSATLRGEPWSFPGSSSVRFDDAGRVVEHIDYWDAAGAFYERLPVIGWLLSSVRRRLAAR